MIHVFYIENLAPYNEHDYALNGGYFNCPQCGEQQYISETSEDKEINLDCCECDIIFKHK